MSIENIVQRIRNITRQDEGIHGDAQRIGQISWMLFLRIYDSRDKEWELIEKDYVSIIPEHLKWRNWAQDKGKETLTSTQLLDFVNNELLPELKNIEVNVNTPIKKKIVKLVFEDAYNYMKNGILMRQIINIIDAIEFEDTRQNHLFNDMYETFLKELQSAGDSGEFYTPRPLTDFIVKALAPKLGETVADFACGTGGFLVSTLNELKDQRKTIEDIQKYSRSVYGVEKKEFPFVLAVTNLLLHSVDEPNILHGNSLEKDVREYQDEEKFDLIMMNPPFGGIEQKFVRNNFPTDLKSGETADLFVSLIMYRLKQNGRVGVVLPDGFLFGQGVKANIKKKLLNEFNLHTIVRLPSGIFSPYTSIKSNVLFFDKTTPTKEIWYYRLDLPKGSNAFNKSRPVRNEDFNEVLNWIKDKKEIKNDEDVYVAKKVSVEEIEKLNYNLDLYGFVENENVEYNSKEELQKYLNELEELTKEKKNIIKKLNKILGYDGNE